MSARTFGAAAAILAVAGLLVWLAVRPQCADPATPTVAGTVVENGIERGVEGRAAEGNRAARAEVTPATEALALDADQVVADEARPALEPVRVRVVGLDGEPIEGVPVRMHAWEGRREVVHHSAHDGWVEFCGEELAVHRWGVHVDLPMGTGDLLPLGSIQRNLRPGASDVFRIAGVAHVDVTVRGARDGARIVLGHMRDLSRILHTASTAPVRMPVVASSGRIGLRLEQPGESFVVSRFFDAPAPGGVAVVVLDAELAAIRLIGRAIDSAGAPLARARLSATVLVVADEDGPWGPAISEIEGVQTDDTGAFEIGLESAWDGLSAVLELSYGDGAALAGATPLDDLAIGVRHIGDVRLAAPALLAAGRVVDEAGEPIARATVTVHTSQVGGGREWQVRTDESGVFAAYGNANGHLNCSARASGYLASRWALVSVGESDVVIVLQRAALLEGRVETHDGSPVHELAIDIRWLTPDLTRGTAGMGARLDDRGAFRLDDLIPGRVSVAVRPWLIAGPESELASFEMELLPGANDDPRLSPLRLPSDVETIELRFVDEAGHEPMGLAARVGRRGANDEPARIALSASHGFITSPLRITARRGSMDAIAVAPGMRWVERRAIRVDETIVMLPAPHLALRFEAGDGAPLPAEVSIVVRYRSPTLSVSLPMVRMVDGVGSMSVPIAGEYSFQSPGGEGEPFRVQLDPDALPGELVLPWTR